MVKLTNKMPADLQTRRITREEFVSLMRAAVESGTLRNCIKYHDEAFFHIRLLGYKLPMQAEKLQVEPGDVLLYCGLDPHSQYVSYEYLVAEVTND